MTDNEPDSTKADSTKDQPGTAGDTESTAGEKAPAGTAGPLPEPRPGSLFPAVVIILQIVLSLSIAKSSTTPMRTYMGIGAVPLLGALLLLAWWLRSRTVPLRERLMGSALFVVALAVPLLLSRPIEVFLLVYVLPTLTVGLTVVLLATQGMKWSVRRRALAGALALCAVFYCLVKVAGVDGNMAPLLSWRWNAPPEAELAGATASAESKVAELPKSLSPEDWPGFRGDRRDGRNRVSTFDVDWAANPPKELWRRPVGLGWSSFSVIGDYCFTQEQRGADEVVVCYESETGEEIWVNALPERFTEVMGDGPRATPEFHKGRLYTQGATGVLQCIDAATGATVWKRNIQADAGMKKTPRWGFSSSPLVYGELVVVYTGAGDGKSVIAYQQADGEIAWMGGQGRNGYSSPHRAELAATPQILMSSNYGIESFDPATGKPLWDQEWNIKNNPRVAQPYVLDLYQVFVGTGQGKGARLIKVEKGGEGFTVKTIYESERFRPYFNDYVYHDGYLYGFDGTRFACMETTNGAVRLEGERWGGQVLLLNKMDMLIALTESGEVILIAAFPSSIEVKGRFQALSSKTWNHPVVAHGKLFVRNDREAVCYALAPAPPKETAVPEAGEDEAAH